MSSRHQTPDNRPSTSSGNPNNSQGASQASAANYRKIDIDALDDDLYVEDDNRVSQQAQQSSAGAAVPHTEEEMQAVVAQRSQEVMGLVNKGDKTNAVKLALEDSPVGSKYTQSKDDNTKTVLDLLTSFKVTDIPAVIPVLSPAHVDILMKYIYKGMSTPEKYNPAVLLAWHEKTLEVGGLGSIVRAVTDRKQV